MKDRRAGRRYALALFRLAEEQNKLEGVRRDFSTAAELLARHPEISHLLLNTTIAREEKEDFLDKILPETISGLFANFLKVLVRKRRFHDFALIGEAFDKLYEEKRGIQRVRVESPIPLDEALQEKLARALAKKTGREIILEATVKPELLGGLVIDFEGAQMDGSFRTVLHELRQKLLI